MPQSRGLPSHQINEPILDDIVLRKKVTTGTKKPVSHNIKVERMSEEGRFEVKKVPVEFRLQMQRERQAKGWTQKDLAAKLGVTVDVVRKYENGSVVPTGVITGKIKQVLGIHK